MLDFFKEVSETPLDSLDYLFDKLVIRDENIATVLKKKNIVCPLIRMRDIVLKSPNSRVKIKGLLEFESTEGSADSPIRLLHEHSMSRLRVESGCASYVAVPVINHELRNDGENANHGSALSKTHPISAAVHYNIADVESSAP